jgi:CheY-like chemotaxis protein
VSSGREAIKMATELKRFDLIITTLNPGDMNVVEFAAEIKNSGLKTPVVLLTYDNHGLNELIANHDLSDFFEVFIWQGDFRILIAAIKLVEDRLNLEHDTREIGVQSIILIEDNVHFYSSYLPMIYHVLWEHSQSLISEGINISHKLLRMRARPKILLCGTYEEAYNLFERYQNCILGVISDIEFPRNQEIDPQAGIRFARLVKESHFDIPILLQSDSPGCEQLAKDLEVGFLLKTSPVLLHDLKRFMGHNFSFGDFVFCLPDGTKVDSASDLRILEKKLHSIPDESLRYHAERNHFSNWLKARTEFWLAHNLRPRRIEDYATMDDLRNDLIRWLREYRRVQYEGRIADFEAANFDSGSSFARIGGGSLGGKARGLGFAATMINNFRIRKEFEDVRVFVPPTVVLGTDVFDRFLDGNDLRHFAIQCDNDGEIFARFKEGRFPDDVESDLRAFLEMIHYPLAVRSSSLLEDSRYLPFAGVYQTYMLPNNNEDFDIRLEQLLNAVRRVYTSTFSQRTKAYISSTPYRLEEEKMAVIIQKLVGQQHEDRFYPDFAGVVRSHNFYPRLPMMTTDGIASVALGLGKTVVEGGLTTRFCPKYPRHATQYAGIEDTLQYSQREFFALQLKDPENDFRGDEDLALGKFAIDVAEKDGTLGIVGSTYSVENDAIYDGVSRRGRRLVTFAPILKSDIFPLPSILQLIMDMGSWGMSSPVEIEFAVNMTGSPGAPSEFAFLQLRPLVRSHEIYELKMEEVNEADLICRSAKVLGNGVVDDICDIVWVDPDRFERSRSNEVAREIGMYNSELASAGRPYILIGLGRWGSADPWLGIPVKWEQISGARVIIETGLKDIKVDPSQGTHFFQNLTSFRVGYFTIDASSTDGFVDWSWLDRQNTTSKKTFTRHLRFDHPIVVKMSGHDGRGIVQKPVAPVEG